ncbi:hypothetical protein ADL21_35395 [Streptomyces albus subsp. albus]|nr:hypothetical protein ADL21_35395 [Streptomyces albus subsp. albus]
MELTSKKLLLLAVLSAAALFVLTVWLWPRLSKRTWRSVLGRVGLLLATQLAVFLVIGLCVNQSIGAYATWADLLGENKKPGTVTHYKTGPNGTELKALGTGFEGAPVKTPTGHDDAGRAGVT